jgi:arylsulfatase A-like enzyme/Tfp pilus assembly protein PilF
MGKRQEIFLFLVKLLVVPLALCPFRLFAQTNSQKTRLNLLLVTIDTLRTDRVSFYSGRHLKTPNTDSLASRSVVFTRAFALTTTTLPSHTNILLGLTPSYHGVHDNAHFVVRGEFLTLAEHLKNCGYSTGAFVGGFPLDSRFGLNQGFDIYDDNFNKTETSLQGAEASGGERRAQAVLDSALKWLQGQKSPWFLWIHFFDPHDPYTPPEPFKTQYAQNLYDGEVAYVDSVMGDLLRYLEENNLFAKTLIVFTGDHGESLGEHGERTHGYLAYNTTIWIPLFFSLPGLKPRLVEQNVSHVDIFPTVCDILQIKNPEFVQGISLLPLLRGKKIAEEPIYFESLSPYYNMGWAPIQGYIDKQDKFIDSPIPELYNLEKDFDETGNLAEHKKLDSYKKQLDKIIRVQSSEKGFKAEQKMDRETQEKLRSLGYLASFQASGKTAFTSEDDVKVLLPYHNKSMEALEAFRAGKAREAAEVLKEVITVKKNVGTAYLNLALIYRSQRRLSDAIEVLRMGLGSLPENYDIYSQLIAYLYEAGLVDDLIKVFETKSPPQIEFDPVIWNYVGLSYEKKGDLQKAEAGYKKSLSIDPKFAVTYNNLGTLHYFIFRKANDPEAYKMAVESYLKAVELDPAYSAAFHGLGVTYYQAGEYEEAIANLEKALELDPGLDEAIYFLGLSHMQKKDDSKAYEYFKKYKTTPSYNLLSPAERAKLEDLMARCKKE